MNTLKVRFSLLLITLVSLFTLSSCDEDWVRPYPPIDGDWRIVEVNGYNTSYREGDYWIFYRNGNFETEGYGGLHEVGFWRQNGNRIFINFEEYNPEIEAYILNYSGDYLVLDVKDFSYGERYTLRLVREGYYKNNK